MAEDREVGMMREALEIAQEWLITAVNESTGGVYTNACRDLIRINEALSAWNTRASGPVGVEDDCIADVWRQAEDNHRTYSDTGDREGDIRFLTLGLAGEAGEVANFVKKRWRDGDGHDQAIRLEIADVCAYAFMLANTMGMTPADLIRTIADKQQVFIDKMKARAALQQGPSASRPPSEEGVAAIAEIKERAAKGGGLCRDLQAAMDGHYAVIRQYLGEEKGPGFAHRINSMILRLSGHFKQIDFRAEALSSFNRGGGR